MLSRGRTCCTTPSALCFWAGIFLVIYGAAMLATEQWPALSDYQLPLLLAAIGVACLVNAVRNRTFHCFITGPLFLGLAAITAGDIAGHWDVRHSLVWAIACIGTGAAALLELRYASQR